MTPAEQIKLITLWYHACRHGQFEQADKLWDIYWSKLNDSRGTNNGEK